MHTGPVPGAFTGLAKRVAAVCPKCMSTNVTEQKWESSDGAYTDWRFECADCGRRWWVEGGDA